VFLVLAGVAGLAVVGASLKADPGSSLDAAGPTAPPAQARATTRPTASIDAATLEGASALAGTTFVIPPPRWLASHRAPTLPTVRLGGLGWQSDPYMK
jgi:hypothetical protein